MYSSSYCYTIEYVRYASVGGAPRHMVVFVFVCLCVCVCVCVILQRTFLGDRNELSNESYNATATCHSTTTKLARFYFKALLSSYSMMCSHWWPLSAIQSPVKSKLPTSNYLSSWKLHLCHMIDGDPSEIWRTSVSKLATLAQACCLHHDVLVWHTPKLCTCARCKVALATLHTELTLF